jgi:hypothetical protein
MKVKQAINSSPNFLFLGGILCSREEADVFYAVRVVRKESRRLILPRTSCFLVEFCVAERKRMYVR